MRVLESRIPPPVVALLTGVAMWLVARQGPGFALLPPVSAGAIAAVGGVVALAGSLAFRRAKTTINPLRPANASVLVTSGIYRWSRNPMYLGLLLVLVGWAVSLAVVTAWLGPPVFVLYIRRFQIAPEERALGTKFGQAYSDYTARVRRWL